MMLFKAFEYKEGEASEEMLMAELDIAGHIITAELAITAKHRSVGLMHRKELPDNHGMLFIHDAAGRHCFWMKNTYVPLTVAFLDGEGRIQQLMDMSPLTRKTHCSKKPSWYALEMPQGWFNERGIGEGDKVERITGF